ncbi:MAG TPA: outer membrane protein assembly factor BamE, partial [Rhodospirillaceae bacterium]|nr:outer membrane protein assembly factor BamE [Rhodospirillaceae bacterium]
MMTTMIRRFTPLALIALTLVSLGACTPTVANRGQIVDPEKLAEVTAGTSSREDVVRALGSPTQVSTFDEKVWYYFGRSTKQYSFFTPEV